MSTKRCATQHKIDCDLADDTSIQPVADGSKQAVLSVNGLVASQCCGQEKHQAFGGMIPRGIIDGRMSNVLMNHT